MTVVTWHACGQTPTHGCKHLYISQLFCLSVLSLDFAITKPCLLEGWLINSINFFLTVREAGTLRSGCQHGLQMDNFSLYSHLAEGKRASSLASYKSANPIHEGSIFMT